MRTAVSCGVPATGDASQEGGVPDGTGVGSVDSLPQAASADPRQEDG